MKTLKKSLSLFLAVVMLLSCWVWVAPEKAAAADGQYYVKVYADVEKYSEKTSNAKLTVYYNENHGVGAGKSTYQDIPNSQLSTNGDNRLLFSGYVDGFPTGANFYSYITKKTGGTTLRIGYLRMYVGKDEASCTNLIAGNRSKDSAEKKASLIDGDQELSFGITTGYITEGTDDYTEKYPKITTVNGKPSSAITVEVPSYDSEAEDKSVFSSKFTLSIYDQYGVKFNSTVMEDYLEIGLKDIENAALDLDSKFTKEERALWYENGNVWYNKEVQALLPGKQNLKYYLYYHFLNDSLSGVTNGKRELLSTITLKYPEYSITVDPAGSVKVPIYGEDPIVLAPTMDMSDGNTMSNKWSHTGVYQTSATKFPKGSASVDGYIFMGFWTKPQPVSTTTKTEPTDYNSLEAEFAIPVSSEDFVKVYGGKKEGTEGYTPYVTKDGKTYYDAGILWEADKSKMAVEDIDYYGWWLAEDITVNFYDIDGAYLGSKTTKHNKIESTDWYPEPKDGYVSGAFTYQGFAGKWRDITGAFVTEGSHQFLSKNKTLTLTPVYEVKEYKDTYSIKFISPLTGAPIDPTPNNNVASGDYAYRHLLEGANIAPAQNVPVDIAYGYDYSYEFSGWSSQVPANGKYHTVLKDDTSFVENSDWIVRDDVTYYAVYRATIKEYVVAFGYTDTTGADNTLIMHIPYGAAIYTPDEINRTYAFEGKGYNLLSWGYYDGADLDAVLDVDDVIVLNENNVSITDDNRVGGNETPVVFDANYDKGTPMPYTITFKYKNAKGVDKTYTIEVNHGSQITADKIEDLAVPAEYDDGAALYTFANKWIVTEGASEKADYAANELTTFAPTSHVTFEAAYGEGVPFYTVTYVDGDNTYSERVLKGLNVPAWLENGEVYIPTKADAATGEYVFAGWFNEKQLDRDFEKTNGTEYTATSTVEADLVLYPQFTFKPFTYKITFLNWDGTLLAEGEFEAGESFKDTLDAAEMAAQKAADKEYFYTFIGWDYNPGNSVCGGQEMTYTAQYKPSYITYKARWYADEGSMNNAITEFETVGNDGLLAITNHIYGAAVYAPSVNLVIPQGEVFDGWYYKDGTTEIKYQRGMTITSSMNFYAKTKVPEAEKGFVVTTVINGDTTAYRIEENNTAEVIGKPLDGFVDAASHNKFVGWYTTAEFTEGTEFDITAIVTEDVTVYAKFEVSAHVMDQKELLEAPTYYATGSEYVWCACDKENTIAKDANGEYVATEIPVLQDKTAPTGAIHLGGQSWSSTGEPAYTTDNDPISIRVNKKADVIITANDAGIGVRVIRAFAFPANTVLTAENYGAAQQVAVEVFRDDTQNINNNANYVVKLGDFSVAKLNEDGTPVIDENGNVEYTALKDGEAYIIYYYVNDKATEVNGAPATGNQLNRLVRTAKFIYDATAPDFYITGDSNYDPDSDSNPSVITYCGQAIIRDIENKATLTVNGEEVKLTAEGASGKIAYAINKAGNYVITITDEAGNSASTKIKVAAGHDEVKTSQAVTCTVDGYERITCAVCAKEIKYEVTAHEGHKYGDVKEVAATCIKDGYKYKECSVCGNIEVTATITKVDHKTETKITKAATCVAKGESITRCVVCNEVTAKDEIDIISDAHSFGAKKTLKATCSADGEEYRQCKYCYLTVTEKVLPKLMHHNTGTYTRVTTPATCNAEGIETIYCKACGVETGTSMIEKIDHNLLLVKYENENNDDAENFPNGYMRYECQVCDYKTNKTTIKVTVMYTVSFDGKTITKTEGETITVADVYEKDEDGNYIYPTKESDEYKNYTFAGWMGTNGKIVNLPITVKNNETYKAAYTETKRTYTHTFIVDKEDKAAFAVILGTYDDVNKVPSADPTKSATATESYEFMYWKTAAGVKVEDFSKYKMIEDATFYAEFEKIETKFNAVFYGEKNEVLWVAPVTTTDVVKYGNVDGEGNLITPVKKADADYHYEFAGWIYGEETYALGDKIAEGIESNIRIYAKFNSIEHDEFYVASEDDTKTWESTCTEFGQTTYICSKCGVEKVVVEAMKPHSYVEQEDGSLKCVCGDTIEPDAKEVTITFEHGDNIINKVPVKEGKTHTITAAKKSSTAQYDFTFEKWVDEDGNFVSYEAEITVTAGDKNATYKAVYTPTVRYYEVIYVNYDYSPLQSFVEKFAYGSAIPEFTADQPIRERDAGKHYTFAGWSENLETATVTGDMMIIARFTGEAHNLNMVISKDATCTTPATTYKACDGEGCDYREAQTTTGGTLPHVPYDENSYTVDPEVGLNKLVYICTECGNKVTISADLINIYVYDSNGKFVEAGNATVTLYEIVDGKEIMYDRADIGRTYDGSEDKEPGHVSFTVVKGKTWKVTITGTGIEGGYRGTVKAGNNTFGKAAEVEDVTPEPEAPSCACSCHKDTFWGMIYRFFQKLVMWLTGNPKCCDDPDTRIWG